MKTALITAFAILISFQVQADSAPPTNFIQKVVDRKAKDHQVSGRPADLAKQTSATTIDQAKENKENQCSQACYEACQVCIADGFNYFQKPGGTSKGLCREANKCTQDATARKRAILEVWEAACMDRDGGKYPQIPSQWGEESLLKAVNDSLQKDGTERRFQMERWEQLRAVCTSLFRVENHLAYLKEKVPCVKSELGQQFEKNTLVHDHNAKEFGPAKTSASNSPKCDVELGNFAMRLVYSAWHGPKMKNGGHCNSLAGSDKETCQSILADAKSIRGGKPPGSAAAVR